MNRKQLMQFAHMVQKSHNRWPLHQWLDENVLGDITKVGTWAYYAHKFQRFLDIGKPEFSLFTKGNKKLDFKAWSVLPIVSCPGAGDCTEFCYSLKAWRYPAAFFRQAQNLWLLIHEPCTIEREWMKLPEGITVRLYVDGDIHDIRTLEFWFRMLEQRQDIQAYGYSKSWGVFLDWHAGGYPFPENYKLNLSNGSIYSQDMRKQMMQLPCTRGNFIAVDIPKEADAPIGNRTNEYRRAVREAAALAGYDKAFVCPGKCGTCTPKGHACGLDTFTDINIAIGVH